MTERDSLPQPYFFPDDAPAQEQASPAPVEQTDEMPVEPEEDLPTISDIMRRVLDAPGKHRSFDLPDDFTF